MQTPIFYTKGKIETFTGEHQGKTKTVIVSISNTILDGKVEMKERATDIEFVLPSVCGSSIITIYKPDGDWRTTAEVNFSALGSNSPELTLLFANALAYAALLASTIKIEEPEPAQ